MQEFCIIGWKTSATIIVAPNFILVINQVMIQ